ncbi:lantibiotic dehydratase C-terminal domain-containing protein [Arthrobacter sp. 08Y14]|uniref:lantibiotic dehydratase C-terminal domain-containing protein n=1 Tax=Arthrobacter sp. 08Y14 TaxID=2058885 RepID=UPI000CE4A0DE|nr:lantibiotic dehydratase C-terminal domain-containing protein [Arthrobacter sp. 08Y14]
MSQVVATRREVQQVGAVPARSLPQKADVTGWWVLTVQPARPEVCDAAVRHVATPLIAQARLWGAERSFYTRHLDAREPSVQVHFLVRGEIAGRLKGFAQALALQCSPQLGELDLKHRGEYPPPQGGPATPHVEAVMASFGGIKGIALTCEVAELSSDLAAWGLGRFEAAGTRSALAALLLHDTAYALMRGPRSALWPDRRALSWDYYWTRHLRSCTDSFGPQAERARQALTLRTATQAVQTLNIMSAIASEPSVDNCRKRWSRAVDSYLYQADKARISRSAEFLTIYQSRRLLNRFGITPPEEAALGLYSHAWSQDREPKTDRSRP